jgi:hypothetical protein
MLMQDYAGEWSYMQAACLTRRIGRRVNKQIFVSYSHQDKDWLDRLTAALAPLVRRGETEIWADTMIQPGEDWQQRLDDQLGHSNVAVLLVSVWFFDSTFITDVELPRVLQAADQGRLTLVWVPISASLWEATELRKFQAAIDPHRPLDQMTDAEAQQALVTIGKLIGSARTLTDIGRAMHIIDRSYDGLAQQAGWDPRTSPYRVVAHHTGTSVAFNLRDEPNRPVEVITAEDLVQLPDEDHRLIQALEQRMSNEYERWASYIRSSAPLLIWNSMNIRLQAEPCVRSCSVFSTFFHSSWARTSRTTTSASGLLVMKL